MAGAVRRFIVPAIVVVVATAVLIGLGTWQLQRLAWKNALIEAVETRTEMPPIPAPGPAEWAALDFETAEYQPVTVTGTFRHDREIHVFYALTSPRGPVGGQGYFVLTPLETEDGRTAIVNRGFVPSDRKDAATRPEGQVAGEVTVTGLLRRPDARGAFTPADDVAGNVWFTRDAATIAAALGYPAGRVAPYTIDADYDPDLPGGLPQGGETLVTFPNNHLGYAITWYGLALALVGVFAAYVRSRLQEPPAA